MAIGDAVAAFLGTAESNRQPSSGVEEQLSSIIENSGSTSPNLYDGSNTILITGDDFMNSAIMITNTIYFRKLGASDYIYLGGVQTNA